MNASRVLSRNNVNVLGHGSQTMIFAHGFGCDQNMWRFVVPYFEKEYRIVLFDYVGCGKSDLKAYNPQRYENLNGYAQDLLEVCEALDLQDAIFVGHSVSSTIGILASLKDKRRFSQLILVGPSPCYIDDLPNYRGGFMRSDIEELLATMQKNYIGWSNFLAPAIMKNTEQRPELASELVTSFCSTDPEIAHRFAEATFLSDNRSDLENVMTPALILQCSEDMIAPREVGEFMRRAMPQSTFHQLQATGHCPHMSAPAETAAAIKNYLARGV
jgi:sigma-B regulation protein RsbQ